MTGRLLVCLVLCLKCARGVDVDCVKLSESPVKISCSNSGLTEFPKNLTELVEYLDLSRNSLRSLPADVGRLVELKYLNLARNQLTSLPGEFGDLWKLERLDLTQNDIRDVAGGVGVLTRLPNLRVLYLRQNPISGLEDLANVAVRALDASRCSIKNVTSASLLGLPELLSLNLAGNPLKMVVNTTSEKLKWLDLSSCMLNYLPPDTFRGVPLLEQLKISNNPTLVYSTRKETLTHSWLKRLDASGCNLDRPGLHGLPSLTHATLSQNVVRFLPDRIFAKNGALIQLDLSGNGLSRINASSFVGLPKLESLDLSANNLEHIPPAAFRDATELITLNLSYNDIRVFPRLTTSAVSVDLSANLIQSIPRNSLSGVWRIKSLDVSRNRLERFECGVDSRTLTTLVLEGNRLVKLSNESFDNLPMLSRLDLSGNRLTEGFDPEIFANNVDLQTLHLHDNPWRCDCSQLLPTYLYLTQVPRKTSLISLICQSPSNVSGYTWSTACGRSWTIDHNVSLESNRAFAFAMVGVLLAFFAFGSVISIGHTIKAKRRQAELRLREAERAEARERLILHRRSRELEAERAREQHEPRIHPAELVGPPTYEEAVKMPRLARSLDNLGDLSEGLGQSQQSLSQSAWERKRRMQRKRAPKRARSENDLLSRREDRGRKERKKSAKVTNENGKARKESESEEPTSDANSSWGRGKRTGRRKKRQLARRNGNSSDDEDSDRRASTVGRVEVIQLPREPRGGRYRPSSPSLVSSPESVDPLGEVTRSRVV